MCLGNILADANEGHAHERKRGDQNRFLWGSSNSLWWTESLSDLLVTTAVLLESGPEKLQLIMQAFLVIKGTGHVHQHEKYNLLVRRAVVVVVVVEVVNEMEGSVSGFMADFVAQ
jgi:hypothetical protein